MDFDPLYTKTELLEELGEDSSDKDVDEQIHSELMQHDEIDQPEETTQPFVDHVDSDHIERKEKRAGRTHFLSSIESSLDIYLKSLSRFPPLHEAKEMGLVKQIKKQEEVMKSLVEQWRNLFQKEYLKTFSKKQTRNFSKKHPILFGAFTQFDNLIRLEQERRKTTNQLEKLTNKSKKKQLLQEELYKVQAELGKAIAGIKLGKTIPLKIMRDLRALSYLKRSSKKQQSIARELRTILKAIEHSSKEIRALKNQIIQSHLRLVVSMAKKYTNRGLSLPDLIQEGNLGLLRAIDTYDYKRASRFITYATWWIRQAFIRALNSKSMTIRKPVYINEQLSQINKASDRLMKECEREPNVQELAQETKTSVENIEKIVQSFKAPLSLDTLTREKGDSLINVIKDKKSVPPLEQVIFIDLSQILDGVLSDLTPREREIVKLRFGIDATHDHTLEEIGEKFELTRERIRQILAAAFCKLKNPTRLKRLKDFIELN